MITARENQFGKCFVSVVAAVLSVLFLGGCSSKAITKPRSEVIKEARKAGIPVNSIEEDRRIFLAQEELQREKILSLIQSRSGQKLRDSGYLIGPADEIELNVFDVPELNVTTRVRESGFINLPLIGAVQAAGLTENELQADIAGRLAAYVKKPQVNVFVSNYGSQKVAVIGAVRNPGTYPLKKGANSVIEMLSAAGGVTPRAGNIVTFIPAEFSGISSSNEVEARARLALVSSDAGQVKNTGIELGLDQVLGTGGGIPLEIPVRGGDVIIIPEGGRIMVDGEVQKVGTFEFSQRISLLGALAAAGGITYSARVDEVEVIRELSPGRQARLIVNLEKLASGEDRDISLRAGDIVRVPSDSARRLRHDTFEGITKLINFGVGGNVNLAN